MNGLKERGINPILSEDDTSPNEEWGNSMTMSFSFLMEDLDIGISEFGDVGDGLKLTIVIILRTIYQSF